MRFILKPHNKEDSPSHKSVTLWSRDLALWQRLGAVAWFAALLWLAYYLWGFLQTPANQAVVDFTAFHTAARDVLAGRNPYSIHVLGLQRFFNPIWGAWPLLPLAGWPVPVAFFVWILTTGLLLWWVFPGEKNPLNIGLLFLFTAPALLLGQLSLLVFAAAWAATRKRWSGWLFPVLVIKFQVVPLLLLHLVWQRQHRRTIVLSSVIVGGVSLLLQPTWPLDWLHSRWADTHGGALQWHGPTLPELLGTFLGGQWPLIIYVVVLALGLIAWWRVRTVESSLAWGLALTPYSHVADLGLLLPALLALPARWRLVLGGMLALMYLHLGNITRLWFVPAAVSITYSIWLLRSGSEPGLRRP